MRQSMLMMSMITVEYVTNYGDKFETRILLEFWKIHNYISNKHWEQYSKSYSNWK